MKVNKCNEVVPSKPITRNLTYDQMCEEEGVYVQTGAYSGAKFVVLKNHHGGLAVLFHSGSRLEPAVSTWRDSARSFEKIENATVCFEIKEG